MNKTKSLQEKLKTVQFLYAPDAARQEAAFGAVLQERLPELFAAPVVSPDALLIRRFDSRVRMQKTKGAV